MRRLNPWPCMILEFIKITRGMQMTHVLVTGANGALGSAVVRRALARGYEVTAFVLEGTSLDSLDDLSVDVIEGDICDAPSVAGAFDNVELCIHTAGDTSFYRSDETRLRAVNVEGVSNVVDAAKAAGVRRLVHTSSVGAIGHDPAGRFVDETERWNWPRGIPYMETKRDGEKIALAAARDGFDVVALNPCTIFGPGKLNPGDEELVEAVKTRRLPVVPSGGTTICDVEDVANAHVSALELGRSGARYILGGPAVTYRELFGAFARALGVSFRRPTMPARVARAIAMALGRLESTGLRPPVPAAAVLLSSMTLYYSSDLAVEELDYRLRSLDDISRRTTASFR